MGWLVQYPLLALELALLLPTMGYLVNLRLKLPGIYDDSSLADVLLAIVDDLSARLPVDQLAVPSLLPDDRHGGYGGGEEGPNAAETLLAAHAALSFLIQLFSSRPLGLSLQAVFLAGDVLGLASFVLGQRALWPVLLGRRTSSPHDDDRGADAYDPALELEGVYEDINFVVGALFATSVLLLSRVAIVVQALSLGLVGSRSYCPSTRAAAAASSLSALSSALSETLPKKKKKRRSAGGTLSETLPPSSLTNGGESAPDASPERPTLPTWKRRLGDFVAHLNCGIDAAPHSPLISRRHDPLTVVDQMAQLIRETEDAALKRKGLKVKARSFLSLHEKGKEASEKEAAAAAVAAASSSSADRKAARRMATEGMPSEGEDSHPTEGEDSHPDPHVDKVGGDRDGASPSSRTNGSPFSDRTSAELGTDGDAATATAASSSLPYLPLFFRGRNWGGRSSVFSAAAATISPQTAASSSMAAAGTDPTTTTTATTRMSPIVVQAKPDDNTIVKSVARLIRDREDFLKDTERLSKALLSSTPRVAVAYALEETQRRKERRKVEKEASTIALAAAARAAAVTAGGVRGGSVLPDEGEVACASGASAVAWRQEMPSKTNETGRRAEDDVSHPKVNWLIRERGYLLRERERTLSKLSSLRAKKNRYADEARTLRQELTEARRRMLVLESERRDAFEMEAVNSLLGGGGEAGDFLRGWYINDDDDDDKEHKDDRDDRRRSPVGSLGSGGGGSGNGSAGAGGGRASQRPSGRGTGDGESSGGSSRENAARTSDSHGMRRSGRGVFSLSDGADARARTSPELDDSVAALAAAILPSGSGADGPSAVTAGRGATAALVSLSQGNLREVVSPTATAALAALCRENLREGASSTATAGSGATAALAALSWGDLREGASSAVMVESGATAALASLSRGNLRDGASSAVTAGSGPTAALAALSRGNLSERMSSSGAPSSSAALGMGGATVALAALARRDSNEAHSNVATARLMGSGSSSGGGATAALAALSSSNFDELRFGDRAQSGPSDQVRLRGGDAVVAAPPAPAPDSALDSAPESAHASLSFDAFDDPFVGVRSRNFRSAPVLSSLDRGAGAGIPTSESSGEMAHLDSRQSQVAQLSVELERARGQVEVLSTRFSVREGLESRNRELSVALEEEKTKVAALEEKQDAADRKAAAALQANELRIVHLEEEKAALEEKLRAQSKEIHSDSLSGERDREAKELAKALEESRQRIAELEREANAVRRWTNAGPTTEPDHVGEIDEEEEVISASRMDLRLDESNQLERGSPLSASNLYGANKSVCHERNDATNSSLLEDQAKTLFQDGSNIKAKLAQRESGGEGGQEFTSKFHTNTAAALVERDSTMAEVLFLQEQVRSYRAKAFNLRNHLDRVRDERDEAKLTVSRLTAARDGFETHVADLTDELEESRKLISTSSIERRTRELEVQKLKEEKTAQSQRIDRLLLEREDSLAHAARLRDQVKELYTDFSYVKAELERANSRNDEANNRFANLSALQDVVTKRCDDVSAKLLEAEEKVALLIAAKTEAQEKSHESNQLIVQLEEILHNEVDKLRERCAKYQADFVRLEEERNNAIAEKDKALEQVSILTASNDELSNKVLDLTVKKSESVSIPTQLFIQEDQLSKRFDSLLAERNSALADVKKLQSIVVDFQSSMVALEMENDKAQLRIQELESSIGGVSGEGTQEGRDSEQISELKEKLLAQEKKALHLTEIKNAALADVTKLQDRVMRHEAEMVDIETERDRAYVLVKELTSKLDELKRTSRDTSESEKTSKGKRDNDGVDASVEEELNRTKEQITHLAAERDELKAALLKHEEESEALLEREREMSKLKAVDLESQFSELQAQLEHLSSSHSREMRDLRTNLLNRAQRTSSRTSYFSPELGKKGDDSIETDAQRRHAQWNEWNGGDARRRFFTGGPGPGLSRGAGGGSENDYGPTRRQQPSGYRQEGGSPSSKTSSSGDRDRASANMSRSSNFYAILGVDFGATEAEIKKAYRKMVLKYHPDKSSDPSHTEKFRAITRAYEVLGNMERRRVYDKQLIGSS